MGHLIEVRASDQKLAASNFRDPPVSQLENRCLLHKEGLTTSGRDAMQMLSSQKYPYAVQEP